MLNFCLVLYFLGYFYRMGEMHIFSQWYFFLMGIEVLKTVLVSYKHGNVFKWITISMVSKFSYYYSLLLWRIISLFEEWLERDMTWDKLERSGDLEGGKAI